MSLVLFTVSIFENLCTLKLDNNTAASEWYFTTKERYWMFFQCIYKYFQKMLKLSWICRCSSYDVIVILLDEYYLSSPAENRIAPAFIASTGNITKSHFPITYIFLFNLRLDTLQQKLKSHFVFITMHCSKRRIKNLSNW